jgi:hypothetical protein
MAAGFSTRLLAVAGAAPVAFTLVATALLVAHAPEEHDLVSPFGLALGLLLFAAPVGFLPAFAATHALVRWRSVRPTPAPLVAAIFAAAVAVPWGIAIALTWGTLYHDGWSPPFLLVDAAVGGLCALAAYLVTQDKGVALACAAAGFVTVALPTGMLLGIVGPMVLVPVLAAAFAAAFAFDQADRRLAAKGGLPQ